MPTPKKTKTADASTVQKELAYPEFKVQIAMESRDTGLTANRAKDLLGWMEEPEGVQFQGEYLFKDKHGRKVRCLWNSHNRPFQEALADSYAQEILNRRWRMNGETIIVGKYREVISGQHRLAALVFASQIWAKDRAAWRHLWKHEPTLDCLVALGVEETDDVVNTIDTGRPRDLGDVLFRSELFATMKPSDRREVSKICSWAVKYLWHRTGAFLDAFAPRRTHAESMDFIDRHPTLLKCVKHVHEENKTTEDRSRIGRFLPPGAAAALMYLMATGGTDREAYDAGGRKEAAMDLTLLDKAMDFWTEVAGGARSTQHLRYKLGGFGDEEGTLGGVRDERVGVVIKAWRMYRDGTAITDANKGQLNLAYLNTEEGTRRLVEYPVCGGIDLGNPKPADEDDDVTEETVAAAQAEVDAEKARRQAERDKPVTVRTPPTVRVADDHAPRPDESEVDTDVEDAPPPPAPAPAVDPKTGFKARPKKAQSLQDKREAEARALDAAAKNGPPAPTLPPAKPKAKRKAKASEAAE